VNTTALLDAQQQSRVLEVYVSAFLDCTLRDMSEYRRLFEDWRFGAAWLPKTVYLTQYADSSMKPVATFDEDINLATASATGAKAAAENLTLWREARLPLRGAPNDDRAVILGWDREHQKGQPSYQITWPAGTFELDDNSVLAFCLADANEDPTPDDEGAGGSGKASSKGDERKSDAEKGDGPRRPIDLTLELTDAEGHSARLPLSHYSPLQPQLETPFFKSTWLHASALSEPIFQTFLFPLGDFHAASAEFNPTTAVKLRLVFDRTQSGAVIFDKAAFGTSK
jgi:hypothetical protein